MANQEHLDILMQGVNAWNAWRREHPRIKPDLSQADLRGIDLNEADFHRTNLSQADLSATAIETDSYKGNKVVYSVFTTNPRKINFSGADLFRANLSWVNLCGSNFEDAHLDFADCSWANLSSTHLVEANLSGTNLWHANLASANLNRAALDGADLSDAHLDDADFSEASMNGTRFGNVDLRSVKGLHKLIHLGPSTIGIDTIILSQGKIPDIFLRNAGVPDSVIETIPSIIGSLSPLDFYSCFISYSSKDQEFAERLYSDLQSKGVRCWYAPQDLKIGDRIRLRIEESIHLYDKLLIVLSEGSVASQWVEFEVEAAISKESNGKPTVLFPIRLDNTFLESTTSWAAHIRRTRHIGDFRNWKQHDDYQKAFTRLLRDLKAEAPGRL